MTKEWNTKQKRIFRGAALAAAVLLVAMAFAGAASAYPSEAVIIDNLPDYISTFGGELSITGDTTYYIKGNDWLIPALHTLTTDTLNFTQNVTLDFTNFTGGFDGIQIDAKGEGVGGLFGAIHLYGHTLDIVGLDMSDVTVSALNVSKTHRVAAVIGSAGYADGTGGTVNFTDCHLVNCTIEATGNAVSGLVGNGGRSDINIENCSAVHCYVNQIPTGSAGSGSVSCLIGSGKNTRFVNCSVADCAIVSNGDSTSGMIGGCPSVSFDNCTVENTSVSSNWYGIGGLTGMPNNVTAINHCNVTNCVISGTFYIGGLVGYVGPNRAIDDITGCRVMNCTIVGTTRMVGGLVGCVNTPTYTDWSSWSGNAVTNCAVKAPFKVNLVCGNNLSQETPAVCVVSNSFIQDGSITIPQPLIAVVKDSASPSSSLVTAKTITTLSGIGTLANPQKALGYVIDRTQLVFNPNNGTGITYTGTVYVGQNTTSFEIPVYAGHTFDGWTLFDGTLLFDNATGKFVSNVLSYTNATGYWKDTSGSPLTLEAKWTAGSCPAVNLPSISVELSTNEITEEDGSYTGYVYVNAPSDGFGNWSLGTFSFTFETTEGVKVSTFTNGKDTASSSGWTIIPNEGTKHVSGLNSTGIKSWLTGTEPLSIVNFTIDPSEALTGASINLSSAEIILDNKNGYQYILTSSEITVTNRTLDADVLNTVKNNTSVPYVMKTETKVENSSLFVLFNEFADIIDVSYEVEHTNNLTTVVDDGKTYFIALNGTGTNNITAKRISDSAVMYTLPVNFAKKDDLTTDAVPYSGPASFVYDGSGVRAEIEANLSVANHSAYVSRTTGPAEGYPRNIDLGACTVTFYDSTSAAVSDPTNPGAYTFTVTVPENGDYAEHDITGYSFSIGAVTIDGIWTNNSADFSAVNKSTGYMTYVCPSGMYSDGVVLNDSTVEKFKFTQSGKEFYLKMNLPLTNAGTNLTANTAYVFNNPNIIFTAGGHPSVENDDGESTVFYFTGYYLGDVTKDDRVTMADALRIAQGLAAGDLTAEEKLYGQVNSNGAELIVQDAVDIARYEANLLDAHYKLKSGA